MCSVRYARIRMLPARTIRIVAVLLDDRAEATHVTESLRIDLRDIAIRSRAIVQDTDAMKGCALRTPSCLVDVIACEVCEHANAEHSRSLRPERAAIDVVAATIDEHVDTCDARALSAGVGTVHVVAVHIDDDA